MQKPRKFRFFAFTTMKLKRLMSAVIAGSVLAVSGLNFSVQTAGFQTNKAEAQTTSCDKTIRYVNFSATVGFYQVNIRSAPSLTASIVRTQAANTPISFDGWGYGDSVNDIWTGNSDARWFKLAGQNLWVASAVINGNPPGNPPLQPTCSGPVTGFYRNPEAFFRWAVGQSNIARLDRNDLRGECVTLIARYLQEVYFTGSDRTRPIAIGNGGQTAGSVASQFPQFFQPTTNVGLPRRGAIISFPGIAAPWGHTAIVMASQQLPNGQRQVKIMDSNGPQGRIVREQTWWINIPNGTAQSYGSNIYWSNPR